MKIRSSFSLLLVCTVSISFFVSCSKTDSTPETEPAPCSGEPGPLFTAVKSLMQQRCVGCHNANVANGGMNWTVDCNIVTNKAAIKFMAVDQGTMPPNGPLSGEDKAKITNWINAGGRLSD